jgi:hypothetical protein
VIAPLELEWQPHCLWPNWEATTARTADVYCCVGGAACEWRAQLSGSGYLCASGQAPTLETAKARAAYVAAVLLAAREGMP